jgi:hypothetical protein
VSTDDENEVTRETANAQLRNLCTLHTARVLESKVDGLRARREVGVVELGVAESVAKGEARGECDLVLVVESIPHEQPLCDDQHPAEGGGGGKLRPMKW